MLLAEGACTHVQDRFGRTPLHLAVIWGRWAAAEVICGNDETNRLQDRKGRTALYYATERGCEGIVQKLLATRATALDSLIEKVAESLPDVKLVDVQDNDGDTALHMAARGGHTKIVEMLLAAGACTRIQNRLGRTPLQLALKCRRQSTADIICENDDAHDLQDKGGRTALHYAAKNGQAGIVKKLLFLDAHPHLMDNQGKSPLEFALKRGDDDLVKLIMSSVVLRDIAIKWKDLNVDRDDIEYCARLEAECITELQQMKGMKIDRTTISYYNIVRRPVSKVAVYLENDDVTNDPLLRGNAAQVFPNYAERIGFRVRLAAVRSMLTDQCHECFAMLSKKLPCIPRTSIDKIFTLLSEREMRNFIKAFSC
ncbi:inversin-A-like [Uloborus diversus]|uniref:inversin-A-like n=1 Tax=Uloborus diversus TaxID=327109 RepID=UPI00240A7DCC|nr:inversin-A-like [Uloborus diversus]